MSRGSVAFFRPCATCFLALAIAALLPGRGWARGSDLVWDRALNLSSRPGRSFQPALARDPSTGDLFVAWTDDGVPGGEEILGRRWDQASRTWLPAENLSQSEPWQRDGGAVLLFNEQGQGLLAWTRTYAGSQGAPADGHDLLWRVWDGAAWSPAAVLMHGNAYLPGSPGTFTLIPVEIPGGVLLFVVWGTGYRTATFDYLTGTWSELTPEEYGARNIFLAQVIRDAGGVLHAAAFGPNSLAWGPDANFHDAYYLTYDGTGWSSPLNLSAVDGVAESVGLAFDAEGRLHFLWSDPDYLASTESLKSAIWERVLQGGTWTPNREISVYNDGQAINGFALASGGDGALHLAWSEGIGAGGAHSGLDIYYRSGDGATWGPEGKVYTSPVDSRYPVIATDGMAGEGVALLWQEIFPAGGALYDHDLFVTQQVADLLEYHERYLPFVLQH